MLHQTQVVDNMGSKPALRPMPPPHRQLFPPEEDLMDRGARVGEDLDA